MTYRSCWIEELSAPTPASAESEGTLIAWLDRVDGFPSVHQLGEWAKASGLPIHYVDNCWVRVRASPEQLKSYLERTLASGADARTIIDSIKPDASYVIVSEEF